MNVNWIWIRTCQECLNLQVDAQPVADRPLADVYANRKCNVCKSMALDYGSLKPVLGYAHGKPIVDRSDSGAWLD